MDFSGKVAVVTGAGKGIGLAIASRLVAGGARVVINDIDPALIQHAAESLSPDGIHCKAVAGDSSDLLVIRALVDTAVRDFGRLDIAIANSGITLFGDFLTYTPEDFYRVMQVNLAGTFFLAQAAVLQMKQQGTGGSLLLMSSVTGHQAHKSLAAYSMSKAALDMMAKNLVIEISQYRINVNSIAPGATVTERTVADHNYEQVWSALTPLGRPATVTDIANAALFLVSDGARHITGQSLVVDGGWTSISPNPE